MKVAFTGFWPGFDPNQNPFVSVMRQRHDVDVVKTADADLLIYSKHGQEHRSFVGTKVFYTAENQRPNWRHADYCIGFDLEPHPRYLRLPYFALEAISDHDVGWTRSDQPAWEDREFCAFVYSHPGPPERRALFDALSTYRPVTSPARFLQNTVAPELAPRVGSWRPSKLRYLERFRFVIACENSAHPGYTTEKLYDALIAGAIPIYWGNPAVNLDFDTSAFIDASAMSDFAQLVEVVRGLDADAARAAPVLNAAPAMRVPVATWRDRLDDFMTAVVRNARRPNPPSRFLRAAVLTGRIRIAYAAARRRHARSLPQAGSNTR